MIKLSYARCTALFASVFLTGPWTNEALADQLASNTVTTSVSGKSPTDKTLSKDASTNAALYAVTIGEDSDEPCYLEAKFRDVATGATESSLKFSECDGHKVGDLLTAAMPGRAFVTGVRICLNSKRDRLKGIQLIGAYDDCVQGAASVSGVPPRCGTVQKISGHDYRICDTDGSSTVTVSCSLPLTDWVERPNCQGSKHDIPDSDWEPAVSCPANMVATGIKLNTTNGDGQRKGIEGVALVCSTLVDN